MKTLRLDLVTRTARVWRGDVRTVTVPAWKGNMGVLPGHAPYLSLLVAGPVTARPSARGEHPLSFTISGGCVEVLPDRVTVMVDSVESVPAPPVPGP